MAKSNKLNGLSVGKKFLLLGLLFQLFMMGYGLLSYAINSRVQINSSLFKSIVNDKDVLADIMPPPKYILESYLLAFELRQAAPEELSDLIKEAAEVRSEYDKRHEYWQGELQEGETKNALLNLTHAPAAEFYKVFDAEYLPTIQSGDLAKADEILKTKLTPAYKIHHDRIHQLVEKVTEDSAQTVKSADAQISQANVLFLALIGVGMFATATLLYVMSKNISQPVIQVTQALEKIAEGDYEARLALVRGDELGRMATAFNHSTSAIRDKVGEIVSVVGAAAEGNLNVTCHVDGQDPMGRIGQSLNDFTTQLRNSMSSLGQNVGAMTIVSKGITGVSESLSKNSSKTLEQANLVSTSAEQMSQNAHTVASAMEEMDASIREIAKNSVSAATIVGNAVKIAQTANAMMLQLGASSQEIGKVISVITSIAEQTNLLALNATIEAARAGEAGKGFAVVANEVKDLAKATGSATEEIGRKIQSIQNDSNEAIGAIAEITKIIDQINNLQTAIASAVEEQTVTTNEISRNVNEVAKGATAVSESITEVKNVAEDSYEGSEEFKKLSFELEQMSDVLRNMVARYKLNDTGRTDAIVWTPNFTTGDAEIDRQHQELFVRLDSFFTAMRDNNETGIQSSMRFLKDYVGEHFGYEQNMMSRLNYPDFNAHLALHKKYVGMFEEIETELKTKGASPALILKAKRNLIDWLIGHIHNVDTRLAVFLKSQGVNEHHTS